MTTEGVRDELSRIAKIMGVKYDQLPTVSRLQGGGRSNIEIADDGLLSYEAYERGIQIFCYTFNELDGLMYHVFKEITPQEATDFATRMEASGQDFSQHFFNKKMELMGKVKQEWSQRMKDEFQRCV